MAGFFIVFEHLLPLLIVRRDPEQVLITAAARRSSCSRGLLRPITLRLVGLIATLRRERHTAPSHRCQHAGGRGRQTARPRTRTSKPASRKA